MEGFVQARHTFLSVWNLEFSSIQALDYPLQALLIEERGGVVHGTPLPEFALWATDDAE